MDIAAFGAALGQSLRSAASAVGEAWMSIPSEFRAPTALLAAAGSLAALVLGYLKFWRENRGLEVSLRPGKYSRRIPPADRFEVYPFDLTITNRASSPNSSTSGSSWTGRSGGARWSRRLVSSGGPFSRANHWRRLSS